VPEDKITNSTDKDEPVIPETPHSLFLRNIYSRMLVYSWNNSRSLVTDVRELNSLCHNPNEDKGCHNIVCTSRQTTQPIQSVNKKKVSECFFLFLLVSSSSRRFGLVASSQNRELNQRIRLPFNKCSHLTYFEPLSRLLPFANPR